MADKGSQGMGKAAKNYGGESSKGTFPGPKPGSVMPKDKKHVSTMIGEKISKKVTSILKNDKTQSRSHCLTSVIFSVASTSLPAVASAQHPSQRLPPPSSKKLQLSRRPSWTSPPPSILLYSAIDPDLQVSHDPSQSFACSLEKPLLFLGVALVPVSFEKLGQVSHKAESSSPHLCPSVVSPLSKRDLLF
nr:hypothetical protein Iba_chr07eCG9260 [Ipomoea batatas]